MTASLNFGKYKNLSVRQIFQGSDSLPNSLFKDYFNNNLSISGFLSNLTSSELELIEKLNIFVTEGYFVITSGQAGDDFSKALSSLFRNKDTVKERNKGFIPVNSFIYSSNYNKGFDTVKFSAAPEYIEWALKKVESFFIDSEDLIALQNCTCYKYIGIDVKKVDVNLYSFTPLYYSYKYVLDDEAIGKNIAKLEGYRNVRQDAKTTVEDNFKSTFEKYTNSYVQSTEGWSDQEIDDAFGGEPDAYWNID